MSYPRRVVSSGEGSDEAAAASRLAGREERVCAVAPRMTRNQRVSRVQGDQIVRFIL